MKKKKQIKSILSEIGTAAQSQIPMLIDDVYPHKPASVSTPGEDVGQEVYASQIMVTNAGRQSVAMLVRSG